MSCNMYICSLRVRYMQLRMEVCKQLTLEVVAVLQSVSIPASA